MSDLAVEIRCPSCGYDLRAIESAKCPECGLEIDRSTLAISILPWRHRAAIGRYRAFWKTVRLVMLHSRGLAREMNCPASFADAVKFKRLVVLYAWLPLAIAALVVRGLTGDRAGPALPSFWAPPFRISLLEELGMCFWVGAFMWPVAAIALLLFFSGMAGAASYFFYPASLSREQQNRAIAISLYACAPMALMPIPGVCLWAAGLIEGLYPRLGDASIFPGAIGWALLAGVFAWTWTRAIYLLGATTHCSVSRIVAIAGLLPLIWIVLAVLTLGLFPAFCGFIKLMIVTW